MPDSSRAALWFLKNFVLIQFHLLAKEKQFEIKNSNISFLSASTTQPINKNIHSQQSNYCNKCKFCDRGFNTQSKPSKCNSCENFFHKSSCLKEHKKLCNVLKATTSTPPAYCQASFPNLTSSLTFVPATVSSSSNSSQTPPQTKYSKMKIQKQSMKNISLHPIKQLNSVLQQQHLHQPRNYQLQQLHVLVLLPPLLAIFQDVTTNLGFINNV